MFNLIDTFNNVVISKHRTIRAAVDADIRHGRDVRRHNGASSYIPTKIVDVATGTAVDHTECLQLRAELL